MTETDHSGRRLGCGGTTRLTVCALGPWVGGIIVVIALTTAALVAVLLVDALSKPRARVQRRIAALVDLLGA